MVKTIGIFGYGRFGRVCAECLKPYFNIYVYDINNDINIDNNKSILFVDLITCASQDIVLLCVPISSFEDVVKSIIPYLKEGSLVIDVCSVKETPVSIMNDLIPPHCNCVGTHPLFGPDTIKNTLKGKKIVLCPIRTPNIGKIEQFLNQLGLTIIRLNPEEHDYQMAKSLALIHFLGRALKNIGVKKNTLATPTHEMFIELINIVRNDSPQLFLDMHQFNRFTAEVRKQLINELILIDGELHG
jgi:prephenate dehydrogenase